MTIGNILSPCSHRRRRRWLRPRSAAQPHPVPVIHSLDTTGKDPVYRAILITSHHHVPIIRLEYGFDSAQYRIASPIRLCFNRAAILQCLKSDRLNHG